LRSQHTFNQSFFVSQRQHFAPRTWQHFCIEKTVRWTPWSPAFASVAAPASAKTGITVLHVRMLGRPPSQARVVQGGVFGGLDGLWSLPQQVPKRLSCLRPRKRYEGSFLASQARSYRSHHLRCRGVFHAGRWRAFLPLPRRRGKGKATGTQRSSSGW
jgi:hypothetical protein